MIKFWATVSELPKLKDREAFEGTMPGKRKNEAA
jgi:hypothetical protein